jgi:hypothetical protein
VWGDPEIFRPERWDPASEQKIVPWSYFPFGGGPRICIGMPFAQIEARLLLATILQQYLPFTAPGFRAEPDPLITLRPKNGLQSILMATNANADSGPGAERLLPRLPFAQQDTMNERKDRREGIGDWFRLPRR